MKKQLLVSTFLVSRSKKMVQPEWADKTYQLLQFSSSTVFSTIPLCCNECNSQRNDQFYKEHFILFFIQFTVRNIKNTILYHSDYNRLVVVPKASLPAGAEWYITWNWTILNIIRWVTGSMGQSSHQPSVWCSKYYFFFHNFLQKIIQFLFFIFV